MNRKMHNHIWHEKENKLELKPHTHFHKQQYKKQASGPGGYKTFFILNSAEQEIYPAHKC